MCKALTHNTERKTVRGRGGERERGDKTEIMSVGEKGVVCVCVRERQGWTVVLCGSLLLS